MPPKTILFLDQYSGLSGGQKVLLDITRACSQKGWRVVVGLPGPGLLTEKLKGLDITTRLLPIGYFSITRKNILDLANYAVRFPLLIILTSWLIKKERVSLVYANGSRAFPWATVACAIMGRPLLWHLHNVFGPGLERSLCRLFGRARCVKKIVAVSEAAAGPLATLRYKTEVVYNAVETIASPKTTDALRSEYGVSPDAFCVATVAILEEWKNQEDLIRAAALLKGSARGTRRFFLIGESLHKEARMQKYKMKLRALASDLAVENEVIFTGFRSDVGAILPSLNALVICSRIPDPGPLVALEAARAGVPVVSTDLGGTKEIFIENKEALFYQAGDIQALAEKILYLSQNRSAAHRIAERAQGKVMREHCLDDYLDTITAKIKELIGEDA